MCLFLFNCKTDKFSYSATPSPPPTPPINRNMTTLVIEKIRKNKKTDPAGYQNDQNPESLAGNTQDQIQIGPFPNWWNQQALYGQNPMSGYNGGYWGGGARDTGVYDQGNSFRGSPSGFRGPVEAGNDSSMTARTFSSGAPLNPSEQFSNQQNPSPRGQPTWSPQQSWPQQNPAMNPQPVMQPAPSQNYLNPPLQYSQESYGQNGHRNAHRILSQSHTNSPLEERKIESTKSEEETTEDLRRTKRQSEGHRFTNDSLLNSDNRRNDQSSSLRNSAQKIQILKSPNRISSEEHSQKDERVFQRESDGATDLRKNTSHGSQRMKDFEGSGEGVAESNAGVIADRNIDTSASTKHEKMNFHNVKF